MFDWPTITAAFLLGLFSSAHCVGMCGGIMGALSMAIPPEAKKRRWFILLSYNLGRIGSYALIGVLAGTLAAQLTQLGAATWLRWLAGLLLILMGLYLADWWRGLTYLEKGGRYLWAYIQPIGKHLMPVNNNRKALALGFVWGWLPCGLVYSALIFAMSQGDALAAGLLMLAFGLGTLPSVLATGFIAQQMGRWLRKPHIRWPLAIVIILFGCWTIWGGGHVGHEHHEHHQGGDPMHQSDMNESLDHSHHHSGEHAQEHPETTTSSSPGHHHHH
jgi:sulfite exporter TauE/SafE